MTQRKSTLASSLLVIALVFCNPAMGLSWEGKVVGVSDGDTITIVHNGRGEKIRLYGIDCPEKGQAFGRKAKKFTSDMVFGKVVEVTSVDTDEYGRTVGLVYIGRQCLNAEIVKAGLAWVYRKHCKKPFCNDWMNFEEGARKSKAGLWRHERPTPPWEFRRANWQQ